ncbi:MAG: glutamate--cysteine ligase [bacterium]
MQNTLDDLCKRGLDRHLARINRGIEKESLRVDADGLLAQTPHPRALGSALAHPSITTDYSEALLEFVTPIHTDVDQLLANLSDIHHFVYRGIESEILWVNSMPCIVRGEEHIPIARYGDSNVARMKEVYRRGLRLRYGSFMQTIAGIHFNFSMPEAFWGEFLERDDADEIRRQKSVYYFALIRNFHRHSWLGCYLFGASPAVCKTFLQGREHLLDDFDSHSFYAPCATSLRLSGLGYSSDAQAGIEICYNSVETFAASLRRAIQTPHPQYQKLGVKADGVYRQLNANLLQIENEFYSVIRPKRVANSGESPSRALQQRGVEYVEVRSVDLNPFAPIGIDAECVRFFDLLLLHCLFADSADIDRDEWNCAAENRQRVVMRGREPNLQLCENIDGANRESDFAARANALLDDLAPLAELLDQVGDGGAQYRDALQAQRAKVEDPSRTPSARILRRMREQGASFYEFAMDMAERHEAHFKRAPIAPRALQRMQDEAARSHLRQREIEAADTLDFDAFLADYFRRQNQG